MRRLISFLSGAMIGGMLGATVALFLAPSSGEELRTQIQTRAQTIQDEVKNASATRRSELEAQLAELRAPRTYEDINKDLEV
jgi:gas vesicle protein